MIVVLLLVCVAPALGQLLPLLSISDGKSYSFTGLSLHNQGSSAPGVPNATVLFADVYGGLSVYNVDAFVNDAPPVVTPLWNTVYPGENVSVTTGHAARHVGALDKGAGVPTKPAQPDFVRYFYSNYPHMCDFVGLSLFLRVFPCGITSSHRAVSVVTSSFTACPVHGSFSRISCEDYSL